MLSIVNYGSSDSENEKSDDEGEIKSTIQLEIADQDDLVRQTSKIHLPQPTIQKSNIVEEDDEFLHKREVPSIAPPKREKVKITIPRLSDFKEEDDGEKIVKIQPANRKTGLLSMLPRPSNTFFPGPKAMTANPPPPARQKKTQDTSATSQDQPKKVGLIPYALMSHKPKATESGEKAKKKKDHDSDDDEEEPVGSFFTFASQDDDLPQVNEDEVKALVAKESARMELRKRQNEGIDDEMEFEAQTSSQYQEQQQETVDEAAMKALLGGNKAKRSRIENIQFIDISASEVLPDKDEWLRKTLAGETSYMPTGNIVDKVNCNKNSLTAQIYVEISILGTKCAVEEKTSNLVPRDACGKQHGRARSNVGIESIKQARNAKQIWILRIISEEKL